MNILTIIKKYKLQAIGSIVGALSGFLYYYYVGCVSGTCAITSNPFNSTIYGAVMGILLFDTFKKND